MRGPNVNARAEDVAPNVNARAEDVAPNVNSVTSTAFRAFTSKAQQPQACKQCNGCNYSFRNILRRSDHASAARGCKRSLECLHPHSGYTRSRCAAGVVTTVNTVNTYSYKEMGRLVIYNSLGEAFYAAYTLYPLQSPAAWRCQAACLRPPSRRRASIQMAAWLRLAEQLARPPQPRPCVRSARDARCHRPRTHAPRGRAARQEA
jgi:hypothetical protein